MLYAIVPIKALSGAKSRLAGVLSPRERRTLALALLEDVLVALRGAPSVARTLVVTRDAAALDLAFWFGAQTLLDTAHDLNGALTLAARHAAAYEASGALVLPGDLPLITAADIAALVAAPAPVVLAASSDGGTNALLLRPPLALPFEFGPDSRARHRAAAERLGLSYAEVVTPGLALDVDTPADLARLREAPAHAAVARIWQQIEDGRALAV